MKTVFSSGLSTYKQLFDRTDYTRKESVLFWVLMPFVLVLHTLLFLWISTAYLVERLFAHVFRFFIGIQSKILQKRALSAQAFKKVYTLLSVIVFIIFLPFILVYYLAMLFKYLGKIWMKKLLLAFDFSNQINVVTFYIFDDAGFDGNVPMSGMMKDLSNTQAIGSAFEQMMRGMEDDNIDNQK